MRKHEESIFLFLLLCVHVHGNGLNRLAVMGMQNDMKVRVIGGQNAIQFGETISRPWINRDKRMVIGGNNATRRPSDGTEKDIDRHVPWQAGIRRLIWGSLTVHHCGGTILAEYWVLTAAHCLTDSASRYKVRVGDLDNTVAEQGEQEFTIRKIFKHPSFTAGSFGDFDYDIALIVLTPVNGRGIRFSRDVKPASIPRTSDIVVPQKDCFISGWGRTTDDLSGPASKVLQVAKVNVMDSNGQKECNEKYKNLLTSRMFCAGFLDGTKIDACAGDSGGPLVCKIKGRNVVVGITSWGTSKCAVKGFPGIYTNVKALRSWIYYPTST